MTLREIWNNVKNIGYNVRINNLNGLEKWQQLKNTYNRCVLSDGKKMEVSDTIKQLISNHYVTNSEDTYQANSKFFIETVILINSIEIDHFFVQHFRIPVLSDFELSVLKFAQIAYNAGQYDAAREQNMYNDITNTFYDVNKLGSPETYVDDEYLKYFRIGCPRHCNNNGEYSDVSAKPLKFVYEYSHDSGLGDDDINDIDDINDNINNDSNRVINKKQIKLQNNGRTTTYDINRTSKKSYGSKVKNELISDVNKDNINSQGNVDNLRVIDNNSNNTIVDVDIMKEYRENKKNNKQNELYFDKYVKYKTKYLTLKNLKRKN